MENYLVHHGILGQKWGIRRFQNVDGSLTEEGKKHYNVYLSNPDKKTYMFDLNETGKRYNDNNRKISEKYSDKIYKELRKNKDYLKERDNLSRIKKIDTDTYDKKFKEWTSGNGKYKGLDYYQWKDAIRDEWAESEIAKSQRKSEEAIRNMATNIAKGKGILDKTYNKMKNTVIISPAPGWKNSFSDEISYGKEAVDILISKMNFDLYKEARKI